MAMSVGSNSSGVMCDINTTPLIDVMLVLLVTLIVTLPIMTHAVKLDMPQNTNQPPPPVRPEVILLEIDFDGTVVWNGTTVGQVPGPGLATLEGYFRTSAEKDPQPEIHLQPDRRAMYDSVAKVLAAAQRNRMKKIGFVNTGEFAE
jgi:biopolymer transport protein ExbD